MIDPYITTTFRRDDVVISWCDGLDTQSRLVHYEDEATYTRVTEILNNAVRSILNAGERRRKLATKRSSEDE